MTTTMTMDEIRAYVWMLRGEFRRKRIPEGDLVRRLLLEDASLGWPMAIEAVEEILALRDQVEAMRTTIITLDALLPEVTDV